MQLILHSFDLRLAHTFTIAHDSRDVQPTLIVELKDDLGSSGFGEATSNPYYGVNREGMISSLERIRDLVEESGWETPEQLWELGGQYLTENPFAQCALDVAAHDLYAQRKDLPLYKLWNKPIDEIPPTNYTIGIDTPGKMVEKMKKFPWPLYKIKLGTGQDLEIIAALRKHTDSPFRVDANCAWNAGQTIEYSRELKKMGVEFIEQPLPANDIKGMKEVYRHSELPVIADESCIKESDVTACHELFHGVNIKLMKCGGLTPARRMIAEAKALGLKTMVGCMTESSIGIAAIGHLLPLLDFVDMDGNLLLADDPAEGVQFDQHGRFVYSGKPGTGARLKPV